MCETCRGKQKSDERSRDVGRVYRWLERISIESILVCSSSTPYYIFVFNFVLFLLFASLSLSLSLIRACVCCLFVYLFFLLAFVRTAVAGACVRACVLSSHARQSIKCLFLVGYRFMLWVVEE